MDIVTKQYLIEASGREYRKQKKGGRSKQKQFFNVLAQNGWICHKSHFTQEFTGKTPRPRMSTSIKHRLELLPHQTLSVDTLFGQEIRDQPLCMHEGKDAHRND